MNETSAQFGTTTGFPTVAAAHAAAVGLRIKSNTGTIHSAKRAAVWPRIDGSPVRWSAVTIEQMREGAEGLTFDLDLRNADCGALGYTTRNTTHRHGQAVAQVQDGAEINCQRCLKLSR